MDQGFCRIELCDLVHGNEATSALAFQGKSVLPGKRQGTTLFSATTCVTYRSGEYVRSWIVQGLYFP